MIGVKISDIFNALQATLGSYYVNDFNVFGRTWQVNIQAETPFRNNTDDIYQIYVRNAHCVILKGGSDCVGANALRADTFAKLCTNRTKTFK
jgi:multidrug efflux pump subunit AcrB